MMQWNILIQLMVYYLLFTAFIYFFSDYAIFPAPKPSYQDSSNILKLKTEDGVKISAVYLRHPNAKYTILFSHGNAEDIGIIMPLLESFYQKGFSVFAYDYHGYGTSYGKPSENNTYLDIEAAYRFLTVQLHILPDHIILFGRSLGTGPSLELAIRVPVAGLILESPMLSAFRLVTVIPIFLVDKYRNEAKIKKLKIPILIIHGTQDTIIPFWHGKRLFKLVHEPKTLFPVENAGHNNVMDVGGERYLDAIVSFSKSL